MNPTAEDTYWRDNYTRTPGYRKDATATKTTTRPRTARATPSGSGPAPPVKPGRAEPQLRSDWDRAKGKSRLNWEEAKGAARAGWDRVERAMPGDADQTAAE